MSNHPAHRRQELSDLHTTSRQQKGCHVQGMRCIAESSGESDWRLYTGGLWNGITGRNETDYLVLGLGIVGGEFERGGFIVFIYYYPVDL